jgi:linoleoyl-CoA desaturase
MNLVVHGHDVIAHLERREFLESRLRQFRSQELANRRLPSRSVIASDLAARLLPMTLGYAAMIIVRFPYNLLAVLVFAITTVSMLGSWFHDAVHGNIRASGFMTELLARIGSAPVGFSPRWWLYKHVRLHHKYVGNPEFDPDIQFGYLGRVSFAQEWHRLHSTQFIHMWILLPFATINMMKPSELWAIRRLRKYKGIGRPPFGWVFLIDKYPPLVITWLPVLLVQDFSSFVVTFLVFQLIAGTLTSLVTQVQHNTLLADRSTNYSMRWPLSDQLARTTDVGKARSAWWWLCGGTNFHIAHHIMPTLSFLELPGVTGRLRNELADLGVPYQSHDTVRAALRSHALLIRELSRRPTEQS